MFRTPSLGDSIWQNCSEEFAGGEVRLYTSLQQGEQAVWSSKIRYQVKEFRVLCMGRCKPLGSLNSLLSYAPQPSGAILFPCSPCFLHSPSSSAITSIHWIAAWGALIHIWRPEIADGCDISCLLIWQEIVSFHKVKNTCPPKAWRNALGVVIGKEFKTRQVIMKPISRSLTHTL